MRILVTNDDGIDSIGLHVLARAMMPFGDVVVGAPDSEYSGASAAFGAIWSLQPEMCEAHIDGIDSAWAVSGPPALCVMMARLGAFGPPFDLVVSGINPGANVGRAVYHSGTIGAAVTARSGGVTGIAVSQAVSEGGVLGQAWDDMVRGLRWETAASVAAAAVQSLVEHPLPEAACLNINVPNLELGDIVGWRQTEVSARVSRSMSTVDVEPKEGHAGAYYLKLNWGEMSATEHSLDEDVGAVAAGYVSTTWLSKTTRTEVRGGEAAELAIAQLLAASR